MVSLQSPGVPLSATITDLTDKMHFRINAEGKHHDSNLDTLSRSESVEFTSALMVSCIFLVRSVIAADNSTAGLL